MNFSLVRPTFNKYRPDALHYQGQVKCLISSFRLSNGKQILDELKALDEETLLNSYINEEGDLVTSLPIDEALKPFEQDARAYNKHLEEYKIKVKEYNEKLNWLITNNCVDTWEARPLLIPAVTIEPINIEEEVKALTV